MVDPRAPAPTPASNLAPQKVDAGYIVNTAPKGSVLPSTAKKQRAFPVVTDDFNKPPATNEWWSSLIWKFGMQGENPYSEHIYAHPFVYKAVAEGLEVSYPTKPEVDHRQFMYWHDPDFVVGLNGLKAKETKAADYSDWAVTASWQGQGSELRATLGHGFAYTYFTTKGGAAAQLSVPEKKAKDFSVWHTGDAWVGFSVGEHHYAAYAPTGASWEQDGGKLSADLNGKDYFSVAVLPNKEPATQELFAKHAYAFVTDTKVSWKYDEKTASVTTRFELVTVNKESAGARDDEGETAAALPASSEPLLALYRHQWLNTDAKLSELSYVSPRGQMKLFAGSQFSTKLRFNGVLPLLPKVADLDEGDLSYYVKIDYWSEDLFPPGLGEPPVRDTYWIGKNLQKHMEVAWIADQIGYDSARDHLIQAVKNEMEDWFDGSAPSFFYYDKTWRTLIGYPTGFFSSEQLNDHHFHWGYYLYAAALVAKYDPAWAKKYAPILELLARDAANWDRSDTRFQFLRNMDPYAGHSWANGPSFFPEGNNQESSSEDINFSAGLILWGSMIGDRAMRDLGIYLYATQVTAIEQYWFDVDKQTFPKQGWDHGTVAIVWGGGGRYDTWWSNDPVFVHGINYLPITGASLYLGRRTDYIDRAYAEVFKKNRGKILIWRDYFWMFLALSQPDKALELFREDPYYTPEFGNTQAKAYHWIENLRALGQVETKVTADQPTYAVFDKDGNKSYVGFNPTSKPMTLNYSDGAKLTVQPRSLGYKLAGAAAAE
jgi:endoglucanase Acf2